MAFMHFMQCDVTRHESALSGSSNAQVEQHSLRCFHQMTVFGCHERNAVCCARWLTENAQLTDSNLASNRPVEVLGISAAVFGSSLGV
jgi:hypothetical protein